MDIVPSAEMFWDKMGAGYVDQYGNAETDWASYQRQNPGAAPRTDGRSDSGTPARAGGEDAGNARGPGITPERFTQDLGNAFGPGRVKPGISWPCLVGTTVSGWQ